MEEKNTHTSHKQKRKESKKKYSVG